MGFEADEFLSQPYSVEVTLAAPPDVEVDDKALLGQSALLTVQLGDGTARFFQGIVARVARWEAEPGPGAAALPRHGGSPPLDAAPYPPQPHLPGDDHPGHRPQGAQRGDGGAQARRSTAPTARASTACSTASPTWTSSPRLLEEEGIFYFFEHTEDAHMMVLSDASPTCRPWPGDARLRLPRAQQAWWRSSESVHAFAARLRGAARRGRPARLQLHEARAGPDRQAVRPTAASRARDLRLPGPLRGHRRRARRWPGAPGGAAGARRRLVTGASNCRRLMPGLHLRAGRAPVGALNRELPAGVACGTVGRQPEVLTVEQAQRGRASEGYRNEFLCHPPRRCPSARRA